MTTRTAPADTAVAQCAADLVSCGSIEMSAHRVADARTLAEMLPSGTKVYVNHLPRNTLDQTLESLRALHAAGLEPVPHIAARRIASRAGLEAFLEAATREAGVQKALVIGGDDPKPAGPFADSVALIEDGILARCGVREVGIAGYPEGHALIPRASLERALRAKLEATAAQGLGVYVLTQFSFAPGRVVEYCSELARVAPSVPVFVGLAGPTDLATLLRFAQRCGVSASLRGLRAQGFGVVKLVTHTDPGEQLAAVARYCLGQTSCNVVGAHFYSFGGAARTAEWMNRRLAPLAA
jgi:methylenetetrahydrofolate reductase (NADPH)